MSPATAQTVLAVANALGSLVSAGFGVAGIMTAGAGLLGALHLASAWWFHAH
ncbi:hypothetical protein ACF08B_32800 [Streptomyces sp. NPDC015139]|uniref:hypothetical protein n=1 Tax=Streptomyces sp. NPDC015139 TaxID=3364942 RepID=UPI00370118AC